MANSGRGGYLNPVRLKVDALAERISRLEHACSSLLHKDANEEPCIEDLSSEALAKEEVDDLVEWDDPMGTGVDSIGDEVDID